MGLTKAIIEMEYGDEIASLHGVPSRIEAQFNPTEYTLEKSAQIAEVAIYGIDSPILQFTRGQNEKLTLELFFDTTIEGMGGQAPEARTGDQARDVRDLTKSIYQLVKIQPKTHAPPRIRFTWGEGLSFKAVVESVQQKFTLFSPKGVPLRATVSVTFREYKTLEEQLAELNLQSADHTKSYVVTRRETLHQIAAKVYDDPTRWREIADENEDVIDSPRRLVPGTALKIPPLDVSSIKTVK
jgi:nucleoid-associated protein YgaU